MTTQILSSEFVLPQRFNSNRRGPVRWITSYALHNWYFFLIMVLGAVGNAALAAAVPILIGQAFNAITAAPPQTDLLLQIALMIALTQIGRGLLQYGRNAAAEFTAQLVERDIRQELYTSLLGKSMTFHSLQPVGDIMARATNDVREVNFLFSPGLNLVIGSANF
jgi:ATP-binding cassette subfamily B protein